MTVTLELKPEEVSALRRRANAESVDMETVLHSLIAQITPPSAPAARQQPELTEQQKGLAALLQSWRDEDQTDDPEELAERDRELEEFKTNMNRWRVEEGRGPAYP